MKVDSLDELKSAFAEWRRGKRHAREPVPEELLSRARRATKKHGERAVVRVTRIERSRLFRTRRGREGTQAARRDETKVAPRSVPAFSRLSLGATSAASPRAIAEVETAAGVKLRVFEQTPELMGLLTAACGLGGAR
jgi:hypothetical protein